MTNRKRLCGLVALGATLLVGKAATAQYDDLPRLDEKTANTVGARTLKLGILSFDYGVVDRFSFGSEPPPWLARAVTTILVPNLHFKYVFLERSPITMSVVLAGYYAQIDTKRTESSHLLAVPVSVFCSWRMREWWWLHGEGTYNFIKAFGAGDFKDANLSGNVATRTFQLQAMLEYRLRPWVALTMTGRAQVYSGPLAIEGTSTIDPYTMVEVNGQVSPRVKHPWVALGGVSFLWRYVHLSVGVGYGYYFIPGIDIAYPKQTIVPDASFAVIL